MRYTVSMTSTFLWTRSSKDTNLDAVDIGQHSIIVADGAAPVDKSVTPADAGALPVGLVRELAYVAAPGRLMDAVAGSVDAARALCSCPGATTTLTVAAWDDDVVEVALLGDSPAVVEFTSGEVVELVDPNWQPREQRLLGMVEQRVAQGETHPEAYSAVYELVRAEKKTRNTGQGVWIVHSDTPGRDVTPYMSVHRFDRRDVRTVAVLSDGAAGLVSTFGVLDRDEVLHGDASTLDWAWGKADRAQKADPHRKQFPRLSDRDDCSLSRVSFGG